jgi:hypothetical protein
MASEIKPAKHRWVLSWKMRGGFFADIELPFD